MIIDILIIIAIYYKDENNLECTKHTSTVQILPPPQIKTIFKKTKNSGSFW